MVGAGWHATGPRPAKGEGLSLANRGLSGVSRAACRRQLSPGRSTHKSPEDRPFVRPRYRPATSPTVVIRLALSMYGLVFSSDPSLEPKVGLRRAVPTLANISQIKDEWILRVSSSPVKLMRTIL